MFKSPAKGAPPGKRAPISFVRTVAAPAIQGRGLQVQTSKSISAADTDFTIDQFSRPSAGALLSIEVTLDRPIRTLRLAFSYTPETTVAELLVFLRRELREGLLYFRSKNMSVQHFLTLGGRHVRELGTKRVELLAVKVRVDYSNGYLGCLEVVRCLGTGGFSRVYLARGFGRLMAMKVINKSFILQNEKRNIVENQREILQLCSGHPFITQLLLSFETQHYLVFCMEYCHGGELFNLLRKVRRMKEAEAKFYFLETLAAISHLHAKNILYRDLKPQNIILDSEGHLRLADYGLSKVMREERTHSFCGSAEYMAPQMLLKKGHSFEIDYYCLGALLYELLVGLPPYYSRNQNELFNNILSKQLEFPQGLDLSKDLKKMLQRLLEKDTDLRFKKVEDIFAHPWLKDVKMEDVMGKKMDPPFKTNLFQNNFDSSDFAHEQHAEILKLEKEKERGRMASQEVCFPNFDYVHFQLQQVQAEAKKADDQRPDFTKKPPPATLEHYHSEKDILWRNGSMKSIDNSQIRMQQQHSPRTSQQQLNRSSQKFKVFVPQSSILSTNPSQINPRGSQIINVSRNSENSNSSGSKLMGVRSVPQIEKSQLLPRTNERFNSPININNYINIYTHKSPPTTTTTMNYVPHNYVSPQPKKAFSYGNASFQKSINNSSYKNIPTTHQIPHPQPHSNSLDRVKFSSLQKPTPSALTPAPSQLRNNVYCTSGTPTNSNRGYLSNFKERFNPNQKIKKSYKTNEKFSFNFYTATAPYKHT